MWEEYENPKLTEKVVLLRDVIDGGISHIDRNITQKRKEFNFLKFMFKTVRHHLGFPIEKYQLSLEFYDFNKLW